MKQPDIASLLFEFSFPLTAGEPTGQQCCHQGDQCKEPAQGIEAPGEILSHHRETQLGSDGIPAVTQCGHLDQDQQLSTIENGDHPAYRQTATQDQGNQHRGSRKDQKLIQQAENHNGPPGVAGITVCI